MGETTVMQWIMQSGISPGTAVAIVCLVMLVRLVRRVEVTIEHRETK